MSEVKITADAVKQLRERTGAGMMECKKALVETAGDLEAAAELMRKQGLTKADKKSARIAAEGIIIAAVSADKRSAVLLEANSETDFVARQDEFVQLATQSADVALANQPKSMEELAGQKLPSGETVDERRRAMVAKIGENITVRRFDRIEAPTIIGAYVHGTRIGVLVGLEQGDEALAREIAMHVAAMNPDFVSAADAPAELIAKEREIFLGQAQAENAASDKPKPADIVAKMVEGRLRKRMSELALLDQPYVKEPDITVQQLVQRTGAKVTGFRRFEVGEGIEKKQADFASEVEAAVKAASQPG